MHRCIIRHAVCVGISGSVIIKLKEEKHWMDVNYYCRLCACISVTRTNYTTATGKEQE